MRYSDDPRRVVCRDEMIRSSLSISAGERPTGRQSSCRVQELHAALMFAGEATIGMVAGTGRVEVKEGLPVVIRGKTAGPQWQARCCGLPRGR